MNQTAIILLCVLLLVAFAAIGIIAYLLCAAKFRELAQTILEDRERRLTENGVDPLRGMVTQLKGDIEEFKRNISDANFKSAQTHTQLMDNIAALVAQTNNVTAQANNLAEAIRGEAQMTGEWGEIQLKRILELAGLSENVDYTYQETFRGDETDPRLKRTDFIIKMPGERSLIVDSKNTMAAAERYHSAETDEERTAAVGDILTSVRRHVEEIAAADYVKRVRGAFPLVLMYIPLEEVYLLAMKGTITVGGEKVLLREFARQKGVAYVNSTSVMPVIQLVQTLWSMERDEKNRVEIVHAAQELLQRANGFIEEFNAIGGAFADVFKRYEAAKAKLIDAPGGQSIRKSVDKLVRLGVRPLTRGGKKYEIE